MCTGALGAKAEARDEVGRSDKMHSVSGVSGERMKQSDNLREEVGVEHFVAFRGEPADTVHHGAPQ